jgi:hypothetical protein
MVTKYSVDVPADPRRVKAYSRTAPLFSNPTYCKTTVSLTRSAIPETEIVACVSLGASLKHGEIQKNDKRGTLMMAHLCVSRTGISKACVHLPAGTSSPFAPAALPRANEPFSGGVSPGGFLRQADGRATPSRVNRHSRKLAPSESQGSAPIRTTLFAGL